MGWNNFWRYVLIFLSLNTLFFGIDESISSEIINYELVKVDETNDFSLEYAFLKNLIKKEEKESLVYDKFNRDSLSLQKNFNSKLELERDLNIEDDEAENNLAENSFTNEESVINLEDSTTDEMGYLYSQKDYEQEQKIEKRKIFEIITNEYVEKYLKFWQTPKKIQFIQQSLNRAKPFIKEIKEVFIQEGLPIELAYLPIIESGFKTTAYSRAKAVGPWQFIPHTARWLGMKMNVWIDERRDPIISARYAAKYLKFLYNIFDDWYLALAAYNHGGFNIKKSIKRANSKDYFDLIKYRVIPSETRSYVPSFIATLIIINSKENYNINYEEEDTNYEYMLLPVMAPAHLVAKNANISYKEFCELNPSLISGFVPEPSYNHYIRLPKENIEILNSNLDKLKKESSYSYIPYIIKEGDTLSVIAKRFGVSISIIISINNIKNPAYLRIGQRIFIPKLRQNSNLEAKDLKEKNENKASIKNKDNNCLTYVGKKEDTLYSIALKFGINTDNLSKLNNIQDPSNIK